MGPLFSRFNTAETRKRDLMRRYGDSVTRRLLAQARTPAKLTNAEARPDLTKVHARTEWAQDKGKSLTIVGVGGVILTVAASTLIEYLYRKVDTTPEMRLPPKSLVSKVVDVYQAVMAVSAVAISTLATYAFNLASRGRRLVKTSQQESAAFEAAHAALVRSEVGSDLAGEAVREGARRMQHIGEIALPTPVSAESFWQAVNEGPLPNSGSPSAGLGL